ncbi:MAG: hypothetical protein WEA58_04040 [Balneolaceae bacterium]
MSRKSALLIPEKKSTGFLGGANERRIRRMKLKAVGFNWVDAKGHNSSLYWNINNFGDSALDNVYSAWQKYGDIVIKLHDSRKLSDGFASNKTRLYQFVEENLPVKSVPAPKPKPEPAPKPTSKPEPITTSQWDSDSGNGTSTTSTNGNKIYSRAGMNPWLLGGAVLVAGGIVAYAVKD